MSDMDAKETLNWIDPSGETESISLWECLHDGEITAVQSDRIERAMCLEFRVGYLSSFHKLADDLTFSFRLEGFHTALVVAWQSWPGGWVESAAVTHEERERIWEEYVAKGRSESESWTTFETLVANSDGSCFDVSNATLFPGNGRVGLKLSVSMDGDHYYDLVLGAERLVLSRRDGVPMDLAGFMALGNSYWEDFARRAQLARGLKSEPA